MLVLPCDCCEATTPPPVACCPCDIPAADITVSWASTGAAGNGSGTLAYFPPDGVTFFIPHWEGTSCVDLGILSPIAGDPRHWSMKFHGFCSNGTTSFFTKLYVDSGTCGGSVQSDHVLGIDSFTCSPFHIHHIVSGFDAYPSSVLIQGGFTTIDFDSTESTTGTCFYKFNVQEDCNFTSVQGATVDLWTNSGKSVHMGTATTDSDGNASITSMLRVNSPYYEVTSSRFVISTGNTGGFPSTTFVNFVTLTPATGYHCLGLCAWPEPTTLHATHPVFGAITYTWSSFTWVATVSYSYPGNIGSGGTCAAKTVTVTCTWDNVGGYTEQWKSDGSSCPDNAGGTTTTATWTDDSFTCYVPSLSAFSKTFRYTPPGGSAQENLYGVGARTVAIVE